jgi:hypothetical protein
MASPISALKTTKTGTAKRNRMFKTAFKITVFNTVIPQHKPQIARQKVRYRCATHLLRNAKS